MKRALPLILAFVFCLSLSACGNAENVSKNEAEKTEQKTPVITEPAATEDPDKDVA